MRDPPGDMSLLAFAALTFKSDPPPIDDHPPLHVFTLSIGLMLGRKMEEHKLPSRAITDAAARIGGCRSPEEIIKLIWG